ncbi:GAF domain-containing protein [Aerophototrophica crusticola]|uniref:GAF domain-containing protein n=1 Tax=Aerophototrophica crusticola TaxID=1709002 RepID=A0A858R675_9PROT|nr:GAF domain-containing protein [Rhodospirillaceae bacterium B3]
MQLARTALSGFRRDRPSLSRVFEGACRDIIRDLAVTRASIWFFSSAGTAITCACEVDERTGQVMQGETLEESACPAYFAAIRRDHRVVADDVMAHPDTVCLADSHLRAHGVRSLLDHVVIADGRPMAVLCAEQCGEPRSWTSADEEYLFQMATLLGVAFQTRIELAA